ncbi:hypothetical protein EC988_010165 [Linderina pennispora]|nr:hypothetical protein EC988_010165 [Linderina pennispora]
MLPTTRRAFLTSAARTLPRAAILPRSYTNTSVYTRSDTMSHEEHLKALMEEQKYLMDLLKTDDTSAPWTKDSVEMVSREVQEGFHEPKTWVPEEVFQH